MINCKNNDKIISYIENELNELEKKQFETALKVDKDLNSEYNEILNLIKSLKKIPKINASSNFLVSLNKKIDDYEGRKTQSWFSSFDNLLSVNAIPKLSMVALSIVFIFTLTYFVNNFNRDYLMLSRSSVSSDDNKLINDGVAVDFSDSLMLDDNVSIND